MSIWSTFKILKVHDTDHSQRDPNDCGCDPKDNEVYLSSAWWSYPLRLSVNAYGEHAEVALTREQARELAKELNDWADRDERGDLSTLTQKNL